MENNTKYQGIKMYIADMETDGVYFSKEVKERLKQKRSELVCQYSNLPSVISYLEEDEYYNEHL